MDFMNAVPAWIPAVFTLIFAPLLLLQAKRVSKRFERLPYSFLLILKMVLSVILTGISLFVLVYGIYRETHDYLYPALMVASHGSMAMFHFVRRRCGMVTSGIQHISAILFLFSGFPELHQRLHRAGEHLATLSLLYYYYYGFLLIYTFLLCFADPRRETDRTKPSPELDSSFLNRLTHWWFNPITLTGVRKDLEIDDLFNLNQGSSTKFLVDLWQKRASSSSHRISVKTLFLMVKWEFLSASFFKLCSDLLQFANPFLLHHMISIVTKDNSFYQGVICAVLMYSLSQLRSFILNHYIYIMMRVGVRLQTTLTAAVYQKSLLLSNGARKNKSVGEIANLMSIDVNALYVPSAQIQQAWSAPLQVLLGIAYLWYTLGYSAFVGVLVIALLVYFNYKAAKILERWQSAQMALKDERAKMVNEVLNGIKVVKLYAWEKPMEAHIEEIRRKELGLIKKAALLQNLLDVFVGISPFLVGNLVAASIAFQVALCTFTTFVLISVQNRLTPQIAFVALTLFNQLRTNISAIRFVIDQLTMARVSYKRLKTFFDAEELASTVVDTDPTSPNSLEMKNLTTNWDMEMEKKTLEDVSLDVPRGQLIAVVGKVGSGKSSLLGALLGEMGKISGSVGVNGRLAYVPQQPWIQNMTVRENILFGKPFDKKRYNQVLGACALRTDLSILPHGDQTEIGEKGINLSGGQKARISLARAVYQDLDVYLLDDPLSAVDAHVGRHIFEKVLGPKGLLKNKTRLLVTHGLVYAKQADEIVVLEDGKIVEKGAYSALISMDGRFTAFMEEYRADAKESGSGDKSEGDSFEDEKSEERPRCDSILETSPQNDDQKLIKEETMESGRVGKAVYHMYIRAASYWRCCLFVIFLVVFWIFQVARSFCLSEWSNLYEGNETDVNPVPYIAAYAAFGLVELISLLISFIFVVSYGLNASRNLHSPLIHSVLRSPMEFFDTTPLGRILNRCTNDIQTVDSSLPWNFRAAVSHIVQIIATVLIITIATPPFIVVIIPLAGIYYLILAYYVPTSRQLTRLQNTNRSPIFSHFEESLQGVTSIRAYDKKEDFRQNAGQIVDRFIRCKYMSVVSTRWLAVRLEFIGNLVVLCAALSAVFAKQFGWAESAGVVGVSISYALSITDVLNWAVRSISEIESNVVTVERIAEYTRNSAEAPWEMAEKRTDESWPSSGVVNFEKYSTRYRPGLDLVLKEISADVSSGEKIGIVGRTGAGKSSFALALFRLIEPAEGSILIDGVDVSRIGLHDLRSALTIIPQDPVLFSGTLRFNLDPFERCSDGEIWQALELAHLKDMASSFEKGLSHHISEGGENISVGQRQLVCLARALLRRTKILVLDEATAAVDVATDALIQATIRQQFNDCTVFTIAHRLNTILDYDRIMVLDKGEIAEMDSPAALLENKDSIFSRMVADSKTEQIS